MMDALLLVCVTSVVLIAIGVDLAVAIAWLRGRR